jgi:hypothetical protein
MLDRNLLNMPKDSVKSKLAFIKYAERLSKVKIGFTESSAVFLLQLQP